MATDLEAAFEEAKKNAAANLSRSLAGLLSELFMTRDELAEVIRTTIIGTGGKVDQIEIIRCENGRDLMVYSYASSSDDACHIFAMPTPIALKVT